MGISNSSLLIGSTDYDTMQFPGTYCSMYLFHSCPKDVVEMDGWSEWNGWNLYLFTYCLGLYSWTSCPGNANMATSGPLPYSTSEYVHVMHMGVVLKILCQHTFLAHTSSRSKQAWNKFSVVSLSLPSASLNLLPWCLRLCALVQTASQSNGTQ